MSTPRTLTYAEQRERIEPLAAELERIAYRMRQGAIAPDRAIERLRAIADAIAEHAS